MKSVVFDVGGVLLHWDPRLLYRRLVADPGELDWFLANVCTTEWNLTLDAGRPFDEACGELARSFPDHAELVHAWKRQDEMVGGEVAGVAQLVHGLRDRGVGLYLLTNMPADVFRTRRDRYAVLQQFHGAVVSGEEGVVKPARAIFDRLLERFGIDPTETLFVDDTERNVRAARELGFHAHRFVDAASLHAALADHALLPRGPDR